jgi:hypothetical protein
VRAEGISCGKARRRRAEAESKNLGSLRDIAAARLDLYRQVKQPPPTGIIRNRPAKNTNGGLAAAVLSAS